MTVKQLAASGSSNSLRAFALGSTVALTVMSVPGAAFALQGSNGNSNDKQTICHATNSDTNPYVVITPNKNGDISGHEDHDGPIWSPGLKAQHITWGDIIPPFDYNDHGTTVSFPGQNWDATGQAWFANGCLAPTGGGGGTTTGGTTGGTTGDTTGGTTGATTGGTTGDTTGGTTGATTGVSTTGGTTTGDTTTGGGGGSFTGGGGGSFTGGGGGSFTGGGGGTTQAPTTLPRTGFELNDQAAYGTALVLAGLGLVLLAPRRRPLSVR